MNLAIIKYNAGNIQSVLYALERIGMEAVVTDDVQQIQKADKVIFPGVGEASTAMNYFKERRLDNVIKNLEQPVLGICLGIFDEPVKHFIPVPNSMAGENTKVPQIGWNNIYNLKTSLFKDLPENSYCYFVHGYYAALGGHTIATADYILPYSAGLHKNNFYGVQFHPEKSAVAGEQILKNFITMS